MSSPTRSSSAAAERAEPRAVRTRQRVTTALLEWVDGRPLAELTVSELCRRASVHRVTFYSHWPDIASLAAEAFGDLVDRLADIPDDRVLAAADPAELGGVYRAALRGQLAELLAHRTVYRELLGAPGSSFGAQVEAALTRRAALAVENLTRLGVDVPGAGTGYPAVAVAGMARACFVAWVSSDDVDVEAAAGAIERQLPSWLP